MTQEQRAIIEKLEKGIDTLYFDNREAYDEICANWVALKQSLSHLPELGVKQGYSLEQVEKIAGAFWFWKDTLPSYRQPVAAKYWEAFVETKEGARLLGVENGKKENDWFYCQSDVEGRGSCEHQCDHCKVPTPPKPLLNPKNDNQ